jgi:tRNA (guanine26-N2/guanine27-N2)-dimethyltransferase
MFHNSNFDFQSSALLNAGYKVSYSHANQNSIKTDAPTEVVWDVLREWVKQKPINEKWLKPEFKVVEILKKEIKSKIDFTIRSVSQSVSSYLVEVLSKSCL